MTELNADKRRERRINSIGCACLELAHIELYGELRPANFPKQLEGRSVSLSASCLLLPARWFFLGPP